jgi:hypothetical protein
MTRAHSLLLFTCPMPSGKLEKITSYGLPMRPGMASRTPLSDTC